MKEMTDEERAALAETLGYRKIGKELPDDVTLQDIIKSLPSEVSKGHGVGCLRVNCLRMSVC